MAINSPDRRKVTTLQRIQLGLDIGALVSIASLAFWTGGQAQQIKEMRDEMVQQRDANVRTQQTVSASVARIDVIENRGEATQLLVRDLKTDLNERLGRIEDKIDARRR